MELKAAIAELRKGEKRKFDQTVDLIISLKGVDMRRDSISLISTIPHVFSKKKVCGFLETKSELVKTVTKPEFDSYKEKKALRALVGDYDFFIANAKLMPAVATSFGKALGPAGKMPSPQLGVIMQESPAAIQTMLDKITRSVKIRAKEPAIRVAVGKESMSDEHLMANIKQVYNDVVNALPAKRENVRRLKIKLTMSAPVALDIT